MAAARRESAVRLLLLLAALALAPLPPVAVMAHESPQRGGAAASQTEAAPQGDAGPGSDVSPPARPEPLRRGEGPQSYEALLERIKRGDSSVDFGTLRLALAASPAYRPYNGEADRLRSAMFAAYAAEDYEAAHDRARRLLEADYLDIDGHMVKALVEERLGNTELARFHQFMAVNLVRSILASGDGKSPETAYVVIATAEEYAILNLRGLRPAGQALIHANGHSFDRLRAVGGEGGEPVTLYFNVDLPLAWLERSLRR